MPSNLFSAGQIGTMTLPNRVIRSATQDPFGHRDGTCAPEQVALYRDIAAAGTGAIITAYSYISPEARSTGIQVGFATEEQRASQKEVLDAEYQVQELDFSIFRKTLAETKRTLDDAQVRSPRKAILTYINNQIGAQVAEGSQIAVISDLSHFKVEGEIADTYGDRVAAGGKAIVKIGSEKLEGTVSSVTPLSKNGVISFTVQLNEDNNRRLRSGLKTDVYVMNAVKEDVMRIANASYYVGRGEYELFVRNSDKEIVKRKVQLGDSNFEFVEVIGGLQPGDEVVVSDMSQYKNKNKLKLK